MSHNHNSEQTRFSRERYNITLNLKKTGIKINKSKRPVPRLQSKKDGKDQEPIQSSTTPGPGYHMGNMGK